MTRIPDSLVESIKEKTDIIAVIGEHVRLTRAGKEYKGLCPFHNEKTPSFYVVPDKGIFYCFGCGKGGDAAKFLMEFEKSSWPEAMRDLAHRVGIEIVGTEDYIPPEQERNRQSLFELYDRLSKTFAWFLESHPSAAAAREVLDKRRIPEEIRSEFRLGYAPADRQWLGSFLAAKGYSREFLSTSGLFSANHPDWPLFADRLTFPIMDVKGRCISFGGRLLAGEGPKYLNGPETEIYRKQNTLYALDRAREAIRKSNRAILCEGYMDAISLHAAGIKEAVAPLGTAFTENQARSILRLAERALFVFDADEAGQNAIAKGLTLAVSVGLEVEAAILPGGKDPSEILEKEGPDALHKIEDFTISGGDFLIGRARKLFDLGTMEGKAKAVEFLHPFAQALDSDVRRDAFFTMASRYFHVDPESMRRDFERRRKGRDEVIENSRSREGASAAGRSPEFALLLAVVTHAFLYPRLRSSIDLDDLEDFRARELYLALEESYRAETMDIASIVARIDSEELGKSIMEAAVSGEFDEQSDRLIEDGIRNARKKSLVRRLELLLERLEDSSGPETQELLVEKMHLDAELAGLKDMRDERS
ncbi:MAG TPA: DNA primase [Rectinemataceae bacterium]|nr:DNA primase [Rectinemataceae bacterium]